MNKTKKTILYLLIMCYIIALIPSFSVFAAEEEKAPNWYYSAGFNDVDDGFMPSSNVISNYNMKGNKLEVVPLPSKSDKSIKFSVSSLDDCHITNAFSSVMTGKLIAQFTIRLEDNPGSSKFFYIYDSTGASRPILRINANGDIRDANDESIGISIFEGKFVTLSLAIDFDAQKYSIYINYKLRAKDIALNNYVKDCVQYRVHLRDVKENCNTKFYVSDIKFYEGKKPLTPDEIAGTEWNVNTESAAINSSDLSLIMNNKIAFFDGSHKYYAGEAPKDTGDARSFVSNGSLYIPVRYAGEGLGMTVGYDEPTGAAELIYAGKKASFVPEKNTVSVEGGDDIKLDSEVISKDGRIYAPLSSIAEFANKKYFYDSTGLGIISNTDINYNWRDDSYKLSAIVSELVFDRPTGEEILAMVEKKHPNNSHPRIFATGEDFERIKNEINTSSIKQKWFREVKAQTEKLMAKDPVVYGTTDGTRMRVQSNQVADIVGNCSFMYKITGEEKYAQRAWKELETIFAWKDWHPDHFLDCGQFMNGAAIGYDFLYDWMTKEQRELARNNIVEKGLKAMMDQYQNTTKKWVWEKPDNWTLEANSGAIMAALAICDEERDISLKVLTNAMKSIEKAVMSYSPDGPWYEGVDYWMLSTETLVEAVTSLEASTGSSFGFLDAPGVSETGWYPYAMTGVASFNFSDAIEYTPVTLDTKEMFFLAEKTGDKGLSAMRYKVMQQNKIEADFREFFYCKGDPVIADYDMELDYYYRVSESITMRNSWEKDSMLFAGIHSGENAAAHGHLDIGSFVIDSFGDRFISDLGKEAYTLTGTFFDKYRNRAEGHNTLLFNPDDRAYDQNFDAYGYFQTYDKNEVSAYAITDMTDAYSDFVTSAKRGIKMTHGRTMVLIQDEIRSDKQNKDLYWFAHTPAKVTLSSDKKSAMLDIEGNKMEAKILSKDGIFEVLPAQPFETSPKVAGQSKNEKYSKLSIHLTDVKDADICVCFTPYVYTTSEKLTYPEVTPLDKWSLDDPDKIPLGGLPTLTSLKLDGKEIEEFQSSKTIYSVPLKKATSPMPDVSAESRGEVEIIYPDMWPGNIEIKVKNDYYENTYIIRFNVPPASLADEGYTELDIMEVTALSIPQPANYPRNTLDNDFETRFSCDNPTWICYDLGETKEINYVSLAFYSGTTRKNKFAIEVSDDGVNFTSVWDGTSSGTTDGLENYNLGSVKGRYIRINATGLINNGSTELTAGWFSPTEFKVYNKQ